MNKFKAGDKVICIKTSEYDGFIGTKGQVLTIEKVNEYGSLCFSGSDKRNDQTRFKLYTEEKEEVSKPAEVKNEGWGFE